MSKGKTKYLERKVVLPSGLKIKYESRHIWSKYSTFISAKNTVNVSCSR